MIDILSFRPKVAQNGTAFEAMASIYKYLQEKYNYLFTIVKAETDKYYDEDFKIISLPQKCWQGGLYKPIFLQNRLRNQYLDPIFTDADAILTVDPTVYDQGLLAIRRGFRTGKPVWFDASRTDMGATHSLSWKWKRKTIQKYLNQTTGIVVTVPKCIERFQALGLFNAAIAPKFTIMGHPVDTSKFKPEPKLSERDGMLRILVVSRMLPEKGLLYILEAMTPLLQIRSNIQLQFLGSGSMKPLLEKEIKERELGKKVILMNPVSHQKLPSLLARADLFVNHAVSIPQWEEFFGATNLEAMACGLPCVFSNSGGIPYAIREQDVAVLVEERNIIQLRAALSQLLDSEQKRCEMGLKARDYVKRYYALSIIAEKYHRMLQYGLSSPKNKSENCK